MIQLKTSGLPIMMDDNFELYFGPTLVHEGFGRKFANQMAGLLYNEEEASPSTRYYDFYKGVVGFDDISKFKANGLRYDITVISPGTTGKECKKTSGHYHDLVEGRISTDAEIYEVLKGTALYVLQHAKNFRDERDSGILDDVMLAVVHEGEKIIIPANYGHCTSNIGEGPLVFSNLATDDCPLNYASVRNRHGMSYFIFKEKGKISYKKNPNYESVPEAKVVNVKPNGELGLYKDIPAYQSFLKEPEKFVYLGKPDGYEEKIFSMLKEGTL